ncbi:helix-hairpin-helix domain-containing protein [Heyndrickxia coagulans]|uniref:helix-hairpin-helix domain-containing protein n=1 Tax=Heyndrickxia coagulans TaxID=1398 RepID=UPI000E506B3F|nr:helix-hairpin-helix domain-containing protein [Heyndrickxia coagulans]RGR85727.1 competence protein ComEA [Heyndrickxia coagulans]RGR98965.1 competence protein ComEA [Heyndrickxia coagulans]
MKTLFLKYRWHAAAAVAAITIAIFYYFSQNGGMDTASGAYRQPETAVQSGQTEGGGTDVQNHSTQNTAQTQSSVQTQNAAEIYVDVKGAVKHPGIYKAEADDRVYDLIQEAGGFNENADRNQVNLAQKVKDEMVIEVPKKGEKAASAQTAPAAAGISAPASASSGTAASSEAAAQVNINTADQTQLETLPGIGPSKAAAIIEYREKNGPFQKPEDLKNVSGIGDQTFAKIENSITLQ